MFHLPNLMTLMAQADPTAPAEAPAPTDATVSSITELLKTLAQNLSGGNDAISTILYYVFGAIAALVLLVIGIGIAGLIRKGVAKAVRKGMKDDGTSPLPKFIGSAVYYTIVVILVIVCLGLFGIETTSFAAILAAAGLAIGLAFQGTLSNLAAGVMLIVFHPFKLGDFITGAGQSGFVSEISLFTTTIITLDNRTITIPNSALSGSTIDNCSTQPLRRADVDINVPYSSDLASVRTALEKACIVEGAITAEEDPDHAPTVYLISLTPAGTANYQLRVWCKTADYWAVRERVTMQAKIEVDKNGVSITSNGIRRADVDFNVPYSSDLASVRAALERACLVEGAITADEDPEHAPSVYLVSLNPASTANYQLRVWCKAADFWAVRERVTMQAKIEVDKNGVTITSTGIRRADVAIGVAYEADLDATRKALEAACKVEGVLSDPAPAVVLTDFGESSVNYSVRCWCNGPDYWAVKERVTVQVKRELDKAGLEIPFPQVTISNKK